MARCRPPCAIPQPCLRTTLAAWDRRQDCWIFGYASLLWRPEFEAVEERPAQVHGYHRALAMWSRVNRGSVAQPGLVFALMPGGSCTGRVYRVPRAHGEAVLRQLWLREQPTGVYDARWLPCRTPEGTVPALAFTLSRHSPQHTGPLDEARLLQIFRHACGRYGTTLDYLTRTGLHLRRLGIRDRRIEALMQLAARHGLWHGGSD